MTVGVRLHASADALVFTIPRFRVERGENERVHWTTRAKRTKTERGRVIWAWLELKLRRDLVVPKGPPWDVRLVRLSPEWQELDDDNLVAGFKHVRDQVTIELGLFKLDKLGRQIALDGDRTKIRFTCEQEPRSPQWGVRVEIRTRA